jgi:hypothetical protein
VVQAELSQRKNTLVLFTGQENVSAHVAAVTATQASRQEKLHHTQASIDALSLEQVNYTKKVLFAQLQLMEHVLRDIKQAEDASTTAEVQLQSLFEKARMMLHVVLDKTYNQHTVASLKRTKTLLDSLLQTREHYLQQLTARQEALRQLGPEKLALMCQGRELLQEQINNKQWSIDQMRSTATTTTTTNSNRSSSSTDYKTNSSPFHSSSTSTRLQFR